LYKVFPELNGLKQTNKAVRCLLARCVVLSSTPRWEKLARRPEVTSGYIADSSDWQYLFSPCQRRDIRGKPSAIYLYGIAFVFMFRTFL